MAVLDSLNLFERIEVELVDAPTTAFLACVMLLPSGMATVAAERLHGLG